VHLPVHASWLNQVEIYLSICQRKVLTPNDFADLAEVECRLLAFQRRYEQTAVPFAWRYPGRSCSAAASLGGRGAVAGDCLSSPAHQLRRTVLAIPAKVYTIAGMGWRSLRFTPEVRAWLTALDDDDFGRVAFYLDLLRQRQGQLAAPHSRCLSGRLRQLEIPGRRRVHRLTYYADGDGTIVLLTVWRRWRGPHHEIKRATTAMRRPSSPDASRTERSGHESP
jgi:hypothetical protein